MTAVFPYLVLIVLFFRGVTLEGAGKGVAFLFTPDVRLSLAFVCQCFLPIFHKHVSQCLFVFIVCIKHTWKIG